MLECNLKQVYFSKNPLDLLHAPANDGIDTQKGEKPTTQDVQDVASLTFTRADVRPARKSPSLLASAFKPIKNPPSEK
ncbi:MAG: hypothetical protein HN411_02345 [Waddliaceae bacterium]|jgi:hypothetical protein|nr:hypothetical protein [Waddliaceae bacterium]MBT3578748.1 hypothetical protein [Waddliaceae bacterium]MBT4444350.1 hypothetical protein [Waddliaceae bacterium]MBT6929091.1 hypothetical protein [Waddliaceae bacterium]MBT7264377.1 hypothetical protein [Waddliaceae bacterium]